MLSHVIATLEELAGRRAEIERFAPQTGDVRRTGADSTTARQSLGWCRRSRWPRARNELEWARAASAAEGGGVKVGGGERMMTRTGRNHGTDRSGAAHRPAPHLVDPRVGRPGHARPGRAAEREGPQLRGHRRVAFDAADTATSEEAKARTDTATAIITSQDNVGFALEKARIQRNPGEVAENHISVQAIGTSSVLEVSVTDKDPKIAMGMANALAAELVNVRTEAVLGPSQAELEKLDQRITILETAIDDARGNPERVESSEGAAQPTSRTPVPSSSSRCPRSRRSSDKATLPDKAAATGIKAQMAVGGLLGLAVGLALASVVEALRPTIVSSDALAASCPHRSSGASRVRRSRLATLGDARLPVYLQLAAAGAGSTPSSSSPSGHPSISRG